MTIPLVVDFCFGVDDHKDELVYVLQIGIFQSCPSWVAHQHNPLQNGSQTQVVGNSPVHQVNEGFLFWIQQRQDVVCELETAQRSLPGEVHGLLKNFGHFIAALAGVIAQGDRSQEDGHR